jgi:hypothetical protein
MFKKVLQSLTKSFGKSTEAPKPTAPAAKTPAPAAKAAEPSKPSGKESPLKKLTALPAAPAPAATSPEEICGIEPKMTKDQIKERLKLLYRRHNRAASSLDTKTRAEADTMLDAIVAVREKNFGEI